MYFLAIAASLVWTTLAFWSVRLLEKKIGSSGAEKRIKFNFATPVFILFIAANMYLAYKKAMLGNALLLDILLLTSVVSSFQDLKYREIEDEVHIIALGAGIVGLIIKGFNPMDSFLGLLVGGGTLLAIAVLTRGGMGGADIKLNAVYGAILGFKLSVLSLFIAFIAGALISVLLIVFRIKGRKDIIPFSPFLSIGALTSFAFGGIIINMYLSLLNG
ncbi:MAG TPA: A24 family peptidase [Clostridia bacterium]|nr:A24 family peptidase [Clostridia bacterium]